MSSTRRRVRYLLCVDNSGYPAALDVRKVYQSLPDPEAARHGLVRVIDESGEDYLYPADMSARVRLSAEARTAVEATP